MTHSADKSASSPQPRANKQPPVRSPTTVRAYRDQHWLEKCRTLPEPVRQECIRRFEAAAPTLSVARWLLTVPGRGGMREITSEWTMHRCMNVLRDAVWEDKKKRQAAAAIVKQRAEAIAKKKEEEAAARVIRVISIAGGAPPAEAPASEQRRNGHQEPQTLTQAILDTNKRVFTTREMVNYTLYLAHEELERRAYVEDILKLPDPESTKLLLVLCKLIRLSNLVDLTDLAKKKASREHGWDDFGAESLAVDDDDVKPRPAAPVRSAQTTPTEDRSRVVAANTEVRLHDILRNVRQSGEANKIKSA